MKKLLIGCLSLLILASCADEKKENDVEKELTFSIKEIEKRLDDCDPEVGECTFISLSYPVAENGEGQAKIINRSIEKYIQNLIDFQDEESTKTPEVLADNFISNYKETAKDFPEYELPWEASLMGKVAYRSPSVISMEFNSDMFTGGAHGYRSRNFLNFDPKTGEKLKAEDLFTNNFVDFVEKDFRRKKKIPEGENINSTGYFFENDEFHLPINIGFTKDKIILHYNAYEIAPYSAGQFEMIYPKSEISEYLRSTEDSL